MAKAIISTTYSDTYLYFLPIVTWCWNKLGVDVICFMPRTNKGQTVANDKERLIYQYTKDMWLKCYYFDAPEHKEATYAQCSRLYGACLDLPEDEFLITSDVDMAVFKHPITDIIWDKFQILGTDLVPKGQYPVCYCGATVKVWRDTFNIENKTYQVCLDNLLGSIEADHFRGNYWGKDQEELWNKVSQMNRFEIPRARPNTQFASNRYDRDDSYILDRLSPDTIDFHMHRPGYEDKNFEIILTILKYHYPDEDFTWLVDYTNEYKKLL